MGFKRGTKGAFVRIYLSSPGDLCAERPSVIEALHAIQRQSRYAGKLAIGVVAWDDRVAPVPPALGQTPQLTVNEYKNIPSQCDLTIVLLGARLGTPLRASAFKRKDGTAYMSGTAWEVEDALSAGRKVFAYRKVPVSEPTTPEEALQRAGLEDFIADHTRAPEGGALGRIAEFRSFEELRQQLEQHVGEWLELRLADSARRQSRFRVGVALGIAGVMATATLGGRLWLIPHQLQRGYAQLRQGQLERAVLAFGRARGAARILGDTAARANVEVGLGEMALTQGESDKARFHFQSALQLLPLSAPLACKAQLGLGELARQLGKVDEARKAYAQALALAKEAGDVQRQALALAAQARLENLCGSATEAESYLSTAEQLVAQASTESELSGRGTVLLERGRFAFDSDRPAAKTALERALIAFRSAGDRSGEGQALILWLQLADHPRPEELNSALSILKAHSTPEHIAEGYEQRAYVAYKAGKLTEAQSDLATAERLYRQIHLRAGLGRIHLLRASMNPDPVEALLECEQARADFEATEQCMLQSDVLSNLSRRFLRLGNPGKARELSQRAVSLAQGHGPLAEASALENQGDVEKWEQNFDMAAQLYARALRLYQGIGHPLEEAQIHLELGELERVRGNLSNARTKANGALKLFERLGDPRGQASATQELALLDHIFSGHQIVIHSRVSS